MKKLFLLRGLPGSGKSATLRGLQMKSHFPGSVISADDVRLLFSAPVYSKKNYEERKISGENDKKVWYFIHETVKDRLINGQTTIVDATHANVDSINYYKQFCSENGVECIVVEFNQSAEVCKAFNETREAFRVIPEDAIDRMAEKLKVPVPSWCKTVSVEDFKKMIKDALENNNGDPTDFQPIDYNKFDKIVVFGDIHGCYAPLKEFFDKHPLNDKTKYIFVGDYEDRGIQNKEVFDFLLEHRNDSNFLFLKGNHSRHTFAYSKDGPVIAREFRENTAKQLGDISKRDLKKFCLKQGAFAYFVFGGKTFFVSHAGTTDLPNSFTNEADLVSGAGEYGDSEAIDDLFVRRNPNVITIHGHRNINEVPLEDGFKTNAFNLEGKVEFGGCLRVLMIDKAGIDNGACRIHAINIKNNVYRKTDTNEAILDEMKNSRFVQTKKLPNGITSYSFTKDCFFDKRWDKLTTKARGLFCRGGKVVARSYDKFFNIGERETLEQIADKFVYPVSGYRKENGYLGIVSYDHKTDDLFVASKSTSESDYAKFLKDYLVKTVTENGKTIHDNLKKLLINGNMSLVFEVCTKKDPHMVEYKNDTVFLLEAFDNSLGEHTSLYHSLVSVASGLGVPVKQQVAIFNDAEAFKEFIRHYETDPAEQGCEIEGFVFEDAKGYRVKYKTKWYRFWKFLRNQCQQGKWADKLPSDLKCYEFIYEVVGTVDPLDYFQTGLAGHDTFNVIKYRKAVMKALAESQKSKPE